MEIVRSGSMFWKYCWDSGWMTNANRLFRRGPLGWSTRGSRPAAMILSSISSSERCADVEVVTSIIASRTALSTVTSKGCGVVSSTRSTPRAASTASRSSETAEVMTVLPVRSSRPKAMSSS